LADSSERGSEPSVPYKAGNFLTSRMIISFFRGTLQHEVGAFFAFHLTWEQYKYGMVTNITTIASSYISYVYVSWPVTFSYYVLRLAWKYISLGLVTAQSLGSSFILR